jgi:hypothetical protein
MRENALVSEEEEKKKQNIDSIRTKILLRALALRPFL